MLCAGFSAIESRSWKEVTLYTSSVSQMDYRDVIALALLR